MTMRLLRYAASKDLEPANTAAVVRCHHGRRNGIHVRRGMRCYTWLWRLCK